MSDLVTFSVNPFLITIDGPDGAGKSTFSEIFIEEIKKGDRNQNIRLVRPTRFDASPEARKIGLEFKKNSGRLKPNSKAHNSFFLRALEVNYRKLIIPSIENKQLIIVDSSEIRTLAFILERGTNPAKKDTINQINKGNLTLKIKPAKRIILFASPEDLYQNILDKKDFNIGDPRNINEVKKRIEAYNEAIKIVRDAEGDDGVEWIFIKIQRSQKSISDYFLEIIAKNNLLKKLSAS